MVGALFGLLLGFSCLDMTLSFLAVHFGAGEVGVLFRLTGDWSMVFFIKGIAIFILGLVLAVNNQKLLLFIACLLYFGWCCYVGEVLLRQIGG